MTRELLRIHGMLMSRQFREAEKALQDYQKSYPNLASVYLLQANVALAAGDRQKAIAFLLRAQSLDPDDPVVARILKTRFGKEAPR
jgi:predicted Zn-dependent protease